MKPMSRPAPWHRAVATTAPLVQTRTTIPALVVVLGVSVLIVLLSSSVSVAGNRTGVPEHGAAADQFESVDHFDSRVAVGWFALVYDLVRSERLSPPVASRGYAIASVALYEAIVPGMPSHRSLGGQLNDLASVHLGALEEIAGLAE
jgi:hypothetical protein